LCLSKTDQISVREYSLSVNTIAEQRRKQLSVKASQP